MTKLSNGHAPKLIISASSKLQVRENFRASADDVWAHRINKKINLNNIPLSDEFLKLFVGFALDFLGELLKFGLLKRRDCRGTRTSRRQRSWNALKLPLPWEGFFPVKGGPAVGRMACFLFGAGGVIFIVWKILGGITVFFPNKTGKKQKMFEVSGWEVCNEKKFHFGWLKKKTVEVILVASASAVLGRILVERFVGRGMLSTVRAGNVSFDKP